MSPESVLAQLRDIYSRMIKSGLSVKQFNPSDRAISGGRRSIGDMPSTAIALRDIVYELIYEELDTHDAYHIKLPDGGLILFQYTFTSDGKIAKHRLAFFPSSVLPTVEEAPYLYENDELFADIMLDRLVRFPIRFDFDPANHKDVLHPQCHLTLGQFENCRIPLTGPIMPNAFVMFLLRNFYSHSYLKNKNLFDKRMKSGTPLLTITEAERRIAHFVMV